MRVRRGPLRDEARTHLPEPLPVPRLSAAKRHRARLLPNLSRAGSLDDPDRFTPEVLTYSVRGLAWDTIDPSLHAFERMPPA